MKKSAWHNMKHNKKGRNLTMHDPYDRGLSGFNRNPFHYFNPASIKINPAIQNSDLSSFRYTDMDYENKHCLHVILSDRAYASIINDVLQNGSLETGMVLLGNIVGRIWYVTECVPAGPESFNTHSDFRMDLTFVNYMVKKISSLYRHPVSILGFYHRHPESMDYFSMTDLKTIRDNLATSPNGLISMLVNVDPDLRMTFYYANGDRLMRVGYDHGDEYFPKELLEMASPRQMIDRSSSPEARSMNVVYKRMLSPEQVHGRTAAPTVLPEKVQAAEEESALIGKHAARPAPDKPEPVRPAVTAAEPAQQASAPSDKPDAPRSGIVYGSGAPRPEPKPAQQASAPSDKPDAPRSGIVHAPGALPPALSPKPGAAPDRRKALLYVWTADGSNLRPYPFPDDASSVMIHIVCE